MPKNTTEKCCATCYDDDDNAPPCCNRKCLCHTTTDNGWEAQVLAFLAKEVPTKHPSRFSPLLSLIQHIAKEEYERGYQRREDELVIVLDEAAREHPEWTLDYFTTLFTAMNKQHHETALKASNEEHHV